MTKKEKILIGITCVEVGLWYYAFGRGSRWWKHNSEQLWKLRNRLEQLNSIITEVVEINKECKEDKDELKLLQNSFDFIMKKVKTEAFIRAKKFELDRLTYEMLCLTDRVNKLSDKYGLENI